MFGLETLNVLIGLVTVYLVFGVACTAIVEAISAWLGIRSKNLKAALNEFLDGNIRKNVKFVDAFYAHPLVQALSKGKKHWRPSYIPPEIVGQVVEALVTANTTGRSLAGAVKSLPDTPVKALLGTFVTQAGKEASEFRKAVETHFNSVMDRASGWFKRYTQNAALVVSAVLVIVANVDTVNIVTSLASNPAAQAKMVEIAEQQLAAAKTIQKQAEAGSTEEGITVDQTKKKTEAARAALDRAVSSMESAGLRFGWKDFPKTFIEYCTKIAGLLISILAISLGAPFWFDMLQRIMQIRSSGAAPGEKEKKKKKTS